MRDYCPSRQEQKQLKPKKVKAKKVRRSRNGHKLVFPWQKFFLFFVSLLLLFLLSLLVFYLLRSQLAKRQQITRNYHLLITESGRPYAWVVLAASEEKVKVFDFNQLSLANWQTIESGEALTDQEQILFHSLIFNVFIDQIVDYADQLLIQDQQQQFKEFLLGELKSRGANNLVYYLEYKPIIWEWSTDTEAETLIAKQALFTNFLNRNTAANYGKLFACPVAVVNSSDITGLATTFAELLEKDGFSVVKRDSGQEVLSDTSLLIDPENTSCQLLLNRFKQLMPNSSVNSNQELAQQYRAGAVIFLAEDLAQLRVRTFDFFHENL